VGDYSPTLFIHVFMLPYDLLSRNSILLNKTIVLALIRKRSRSVSAIVAVGPSCKAIQLMPTRGIRLKRTNYPQGIMIGNEFSHGWKIGVVKGLQTSYPQG